MALAVPELTFVVTLGAALGELLCVTLNELTKGFPIGVNDLSVLVALATFENGKRWEFRSSVFFWFVAHHCDLANDVALLVEDLALVVDFLSGALF